MSYTNNFGHRIATVGISYSRVEEVLPFVISTALDMGFTVLDGQTAGFIGLAIMELHPYPGRRLDGAPGSEHQTLGRALEQGAAV